MEPAIAQLAANVVAVLVPYVALGAGEFAKSAGQGAYEKAKTLLDTLRTRWAGDGGATGTLSRFEAQPQRYRPYLEDVLNEKLAQDEDLAAELAALLDEMGPSVEVVQRMDEGRVVTGVEAEEMTEGRARVSQDIVRGEDVTGARIRRIGPQR